MLAGWGLGPDASRGGGLGSQEHGSGGALARSRLRSLVALAILVVAVHQSPLIAVAFRDLHRSFGEVWGDTDSWRRHLRTPAAGEQLLPELILVAMDLLRANEIDAYRYSAAIGADQAVRQRLIEGVWPIRYRPDASVVVSYLAEPNKCRVISERSLAGPAGGLRLARCR